MTEKERHVGAREPGMVLELLPDAVAMLDGEGRLIQVNASWRRLGLENAGDPATTTALGRSYVDACEQHPQTRELALLLQELLSGSREQLEYRYRCNSMERLRRCCVRGTALPALASGASGGALLVHTDITERVLAEERLRVQRHVAMAFAAGRSTLEVCVELATVVCRHLEWDFWELWDCDAEGRPRLARASDDIPPDLKPFADATHAIAFEPNQGLPGRVWNSRSAEWVSDFDHNPSFPRAPAALQSGLQCGFGIPLVAGDEVFRVMGFFSRIRRQPEHATLELLAAIGAQIAEVARRQRAEEQVRTVQAAKLERERLHAILVNAPGMIAEVDRQGVVQFANHAPRDNLQEVLGKPWTWPSSPEDRPRLDAMLRTVIETATPQQCEVELPDVGEGPRSYQVRVGPLRRTMGDGQEAVTGAVVAVQDVTEQRRLQANLDAAQRLASVGTLAAGVAHEINNPLTSVVVNLSLAIGEASDLMAQGAEAPELLRELEDARAGAERIRNVVRDLKLLAAPREETAGPVDAVAVFESMLRLAHNELRHRAQVVRDYQAVPLVQASEGRLGQVLLNLLLNAAQAIPEGHAQSHEVRVSTSRATDGAVCLAVSDTGPGMSEQTKGKLFTPFFTTKVGSGTGLGLAICDQIVRAFGGRIVVESERGRGTTFRVYLPTAQAEEPKVPAHGTRPVEPAPRRGRVLVIDDEPSIGAALRRVLERIHEVEVVDRARDALQLLESGRVYDVIFCDIMMPELTGPEFLDELARRRPAAMDRVIFITGGAFTARTKAFLEATSHPVVEKPISPKQILALVADHMGGHAAA